MKEDTALIELMFAVYRAGERKGKKLNHTILADPDEQRRDFKSLCASEIRMASALVDLCSAGPMPPMPRITEIQKEAQESGLMNLLWRCFEQENKRNT